MTTDKHNSLNSRILDGFAIKMIAILTMTIDHIGAVLRSADYSDGLLPGNVYYLLRVIGRCSFPLFCFMMAEGFSFTKNKNKYIVRLVIFAFLSQIPYSLAFHNRLWSFADLNIFFTFVLGFGIMCCAEALFSKVNQSAKSYHNIAYCFIIIILALYAAEEYGFSYGKYGILLLLIFYFFRIPDDCFDNEKEVMKYACIQALLTVIVTYLYEDEIQFYALISFVFILLYNRQKGQGLKYFFYLYYPLHLLVLYTVRCMLT